MSMGEFLLNKAVAPKPQATNEHYPLISFSYKLYIPTLLPYQTSSRWEEQATITSALGFPLFRVNCRWQDLQGVQECQDAAESTA